MSAATASLLNRLGLLSRGGASDNVLDSVLDNLLGEWVGEASPLEHDSEGMAERGVEELATRDLPPPSKTR